MAAEYDREQVTRSLKESAELADWFYRSHVQDGLRDTNAASKRDELLARVAVYKHLQAGDFLESQDSLLAELRWLLKNERPLTPRNALDPAMFARYRAKLLQMLIQRYELPGGASASPPP
jgi:hypothetical protein